MGHTDHVVLFHEHLSDREKRTKKLTKVMETKISMVQDKMGSFPLLLDMRFGVPIFWGAVSSIGDAIEAIQKSISHIPVPGGGSGWMRVCLQSDICGFVRCEFIGDSGSLGDQTAG
jgi:hypothetical protein